MLKDDLTMKQVDTPINCWCASGHVAHGTFRLDPSKEPGPIRFFHVISKDINGIYCEPCLVIANHMARIGKR